jgi:HNH endonuclease
MTLPRNTTLTQARVLKLFDYRDDGALIRRTSGKGRKAGDRAGSVHVSKTGHVSRLVMVDGKRYPTSYIVWLRQTGAFPKHQLGHMDGNGLNDRLDNLREATRSQSGATRTAPRNNVGVRGVCSDGKGYRALIRVGGKLHHLGHFQTVEEASEAYKAARLKYFGPEFGKLPWRTPRVIEVTDPTEIAAIRAAHPEAVNA